MIVTNVPGPQIPLYTLGAKMLEMQPLVPLLDGTGLGVALAEGDHALEPPGDDRRIVAEERSLVGPIDAGDAD